MDYKIAIPSYKRAETLRDKTLTLLKKYDIDSEKIYIFVADNEELQEYIRILPQYYYRIIIGRPTLKAQRNFIQDYFKEDELIMNLDDDIISIKEKLNNGEKDIDNLDELIQHGFDIAQKNGAHLWGIYPLVNHFYMDYKTTLDLKYIVGAFWGLINTHDKNTYVTLEDKEDFERSIKFYIKDKKVLRFNWVGIETGYYKEPGGMQETRTEDRIKESVSYLMQTYPMFCEWNQRRKNHYEIKLKDRSRSVKKNRRI